MTKVSAVSLTARVAMLLVTTGVTGTAVLLPLPPPVTLTDAVRVPASKAVSPPVNSTVIEVGVAVTTLQATEFVLLETLLRVTASALIRGLNCPPVIVKLVASAGIVAGRATVNVSIARPSRHSNRSLREAVPANDSSAPAWDGTT